MADIYQVEARTIEHTGHFLVYEPEWREIAEEMRAGLVPQAN